MRIINKIEDMHGFRGKVGFVPTMGYLHQGHLSLIKKAREECDTVIVSIYVNPTQFGPNEDLDSYPRDFENDKKLCENEEVDIIFFPNDKEIYPNGKISDIKIKKQELTSVLCGSSRPGHFDGVTTVVSKLFNIVKPNIAYFGQKDYQQSLVIKQLVKENNLPIKIVVCPIVREEDGIAMSSRNKYLSSDERAQARSLNQSLLMAKQMVEDEIIDPILIKQRVTQMISINPLAKIDFVEIRDRQLNEIKEIVPGNVVIALAVKFGKARLIDNILL